jgi:hypothetical protein
MPVNGVLPLLANVIDCAAPIVTPFLSGEKLKLAGLAVRGVLADGAAVL